MAGADCDCKGVNPGLFYEFRGFIRVCESCRTRVNLDIVFNARKLSKFRFNHNAVCVCVFHNLFREADIFFKRMLGTVDHNGSETIVYAFLADVEVLAVVEVKRDVKTRIEDCSLYELRQISGLCVFARACGYLKNQR